MLKAASKEEGERDREKGIEVRVEERMSCHANAAHTREERSLTEYCSCRSHARVCHTVFREVERGTCSRGDLRAAFLRLPLLEEDFASLSVKGETTRFPSPLDE